MHTQLAPFVLFALVATLAACSDGPSDYAASTPPAQAPAAQPTGAGLAPASTAAATNRRYANSPGDGYLALRSDPSVSSGSRIAQIPHGAPVDIGSCEGRTETIGGRSGRWCQARYDGQSGYVFDAFLASSAPSPRAATQSASSGGARTSRPSGGGYSLGPNPNLEYNGPYELSGETVICETYDRTSVAAFRGMQLCYRIHLDQHPRDGSLAGSGRKISEETPSGGFRDLPPAEQSPVQVSGYVDANNVIHLEYAVRGARRTTRAVAQYRPSGEGPDTFRGTFRTDAANASGAAVFESY